MKPRGIFRNATLWFLVLQAGGLSLGPLVASELLVTPKPAGAEVRWLPPAAGLVGPTELRLQRSIDLQRWENVGAKQRLPAGATGARVLAGDETGDRGFYRLVTRENVEFTSNEGAEILGYAGAFADEVDALGNFGVSDFAARYPASFDYLPGLTWDPTTALYWNEFNDPNPVGHGPSGEVAMPSTALSADELAVFMTNGFVVSERLGASNFADIYYDVFRRDLPVFVSTDSILHAWHRSYDGILEDLELQALQPLLKQLLADMAAQVDPAYLSYGKGPLKDSVRDADYYLTVAQRLLGMTATSRFGQEARVQATLSAIEAGGQIPFAFFGESAPEVVDFSQFRPRGHYTKEFPPAWGGSLANYFRAMVWLGRVDLRVAGNTNYASPRQLGTAVVLQDLLKRSGRFNSWRQIDQTLNVMVGPADSMSFEQLGPLLQSVLITSPARIQSLTQLQQLQADLEAGTLGTQNIQGHSFLGRLGDDQIKLPRSFTFLGQRFTADAWTLHNVTLDRIVVPGSDPAKLVRRRLPYSLDVAFGVLGNNQVVPDLIANMLNPAGVAFRDGYSYQRNLAAVRIVLDQAPASVWEGNLYNRWLLTLRTLSEPTTGPEYPEAMRNQAWARKTLNTQLASWTQLRHDTVLYVKPTETPMNLCVYPYGFVEPRPAFFQRLREMAEVARDQLGGLSTAAILTGKTQPFLSRFASNCLMLEAIARKELLQESLASSETNFLGNLVEQSIEYFSGERKYSGWYPRMFYRGSEGILPLPPVIPKPGNVILPPVHDSAQMDYVVVDVHTDGFSDVDGDHGAVLHEGVGPVNLLMMAVDNGPDRIIYAGPVLSHYEFLKPYGTRLTDAEWKATVIAGAAPPPPPWTQSYLVRRTAP